MERLSAFCPRRKGQAVALLQKQKRKKKTYGFELRFGDAAGIFGVALALRGCFCSVAHGCDVCLVYLCLVGGVECGDVVVLVWRFIVDRDCGG